MAENVFIKPAVAGAIVPDPHDGGRALRADGEWKPLNSYWAARLRDKDVVEKVSETADGGEKAMTPRRPISKK